MAAMSGGESARELAHGQICSACKSLWCWFPDASNEPVTQHGEACDALTAAIEARDAFHAAREATLREALERACQFALQYGEMLHCSGDCKALFFDNCHDEDVGCGELQETAANLRRLAAPGTPPTLEEETPHETAR